MTDPWAEGAAFKRRVDAELELFVRQECAQLLAVDRELAPVAEQLRVAMGEGKRMRAAFCYWGWRAAGGPDSDEMVRAAAAMELIHAAAVVHDDIIDDSAIRRGSPTAHVALRAAFATRTGRPAAARALAILVGDLLLSWAGQLFTSCGLPGAYLARARPLWATLARELVAGECLEILRAGTRSGTESSLQIIRYKTAKYTVEHPLQIGGRLAGASPALMADLSAYGVPLGEAFQLRDDLLGIFGDPEDTGKSNLDDIVGRKPTALLAVTLAAATPVERRELRALLGSRRLDQDGLARMREIMRRVGAPARIESLITERVRAATAALDRAGLPQAAAQALSRLVDAATDRHT